MLKRKGNKKVQSDDEGLAIQLEGQSQTIISSSEDESRLLVSTKKRLNQKAREKSDPALSTSSRNGSESSLPEIARSRGPSRNVTPRSPRMKTDR
eukprot:UN01287